MKITKQHQVIMHPDMVRVSPPKEAHLGAGMRDHRKYRGANFLICQAESLLGLSII